MGGVESVQEKNQRLFTQYIETSQQATGPVVFPYRNLSELREDVGSRLDRQILSHQREDVNRVGCSWFVSTGKWLFSNVTGQEWRVDISIPLTELGWFLDWYVKTRLAKCPTPTLIPPPQPPTPSFSPQQVPPPPQPEPVSEAMILKKLDEHLHHLQQSVEEEISKPAVRRNVWRQASLLIHPDQCRKPHSREQLSFAKFPKTVLAFEQLSDFVLQHSEHRSICEEGFKKWNQLRAQVVNK